MIAEPKNEVEKLLSLICQSGQIRIEAGQLLVSPEAAQQFGDQIRRCKPEIFVALGHCPQCGGKLIKETVRRLDRKGKPIGGGKFTHCSNRDHYEDWRL